MYILDNYLYGFAEVNMNRSSNPFSSHRVLCIFTKALQKGCGCTEMEMQVELAGTCHSFPFAKLILSLSHQTIGSSVICHFHVLLLSLSYHLRSQYPHLYS